MRGFLGVPHVGPLGNACDCVAVADCVDGTVQHDGGGKAKRPCARSAPCRVSSWPKRNSMMPESLRANVFRYSF